MTEKELGRLKRPDLLALLVAQGQEAGAVQAQLDETQAALEEAQQLTGRLKEKLDEKDEQIEHLKEKLDEKDEQIERLKNKLNEKDTQLEHLKKRLNDKDDRISVLTSQIEDLISGRYLEMEGIHSLTDISNRLDLMLRMAQKAASQYIEQIQQPAESGGARKEGTE